MYVAAVPNRNSPPAMLLRESYREGKKVKNRTIANITHWPDQRIDALKRALKGEFDGLLADTDTNDRVFGTMYATKHIAHTIGIQSALGNGTMGKLALFLVLARLAHHGSRLSAVRWAKAQAVPEILALADFDEDDLYETLDWLDANQARIERHLYRRYLKEHKEPPALVLYDVTSSYFEGQHNELAEHGYNRDGKKGKKQIVIGLLSTSDGEPLAVRVFKGNTTDNTTVIEQINLLKEEFKIQEVIFVGDRGMVKRKQKAALTEAELRYITALTDPQIHKLFKEGVLQPELFDETICEAKHGSLRLVLRRNDATRRKEEHRRNDKLSRLTSLVEQRNEFVRTSKRANPEAGLRRLQNWTKRYKLSKFVTLSLSDKEIIQDMNEKKKEEASQLDGCYVLETNVSGDILNTQEVDDRYNDLQHVEANFRMMKTELLEVRPIYLRKGNRTKGHVLVAMLALKMARYMREHLSLVFGTTNDDPHTITLNDALASLSSWCFVRSQTKRGSFLRIPNPNEQLSQILDSLGVPIPKMRAMRSA